MVGAGSAVDRVRRPQAPPNLIEISAPVAASGATPCAIPPGSQVYGGLDDHVDDLIDAKLGGIDHERVLGRPEG